MAVRQGRSELDRLRLDLDESQRREIALRAAIVRVLATDERYREGAARPAFGMESLFRPKHEPYLLNEDRAALEAALER